jgi:predicted enzyme related to lactoylglutathione lyase
MPTVSVKIDHEAAAVAGSERPDTQERFVIRGELPRMADLRHLLSLYRKTGCLDLPYTLPMPNNLVKFAINADDVSRARRFYEKVFDWRFEPWGPPDFYLIQTGNEPASGVGGLMQQRRELVKGVRMIGYECTVGVENIDETIRAIGANNGTIVMPKFHIPTVGSGTYFNDPEGNVACAMQYEPRAK